MVKLIKTYKGFEVYASRVEQDEGEKGNVYFLSSISIPKKHPRYNTKNPYFTDADFNNEEYEIDTYRIGDVWGQAKKYINKFLLTNKTTTKERLEMLSERLNSNDFKFKLELSREGKDILNKKISAVKEPEVFKKISNMSKAIFKDEESIKKIPNLVSAYLKGSRKMIVLEFFTKDKKRYPITYNIKEL